METTIRVHNSVIPIEKILKAQVIQKSNYDKPKHGSTKPSRGNFIGYSYDVVLYLGGECSATVKCGQEHEAYEYLDKIQKTIEEYYNSKYSPSS